MYTHCKCLLYQKIYIDKNSNLANPKDRATILQKSWVIYRYKCGRVDCDEEYNDKSGRTFVERFKNRGRPPYSSMTITTPQVMTYLLIILALWAEKTKTCQDPSKRQFHQSQGPIPEQEYRQIPTATYMG